METMILTRQEAADAMKVSLPTLDAYLKRESNPLPFLIPYDDFKRWLSQESARCMSNGCAV